MNNLNQLKDTTITNILRVAGYNQNSHLRSIIEQELDKLLLELNFKPNDSEDHKVIYDSKIVEDMHKEPWRYFTHYTSGLFNAYMVINDLWFYYDLEAKQWKKSLIASTHLKRTLRTNSFKDSYSYKKYFK